MLTKEKRKYPVVRFCGFTGIWNQRTLGNLSEKVTEKNTHQIVAIDKINETAHYDSYCKKHGDAALKRYKYQREFRKNLERMFNKDILPLRGEDNV